MFVDIGTGDGRFVLAQARANPDALCIGVDASKDGLIEASKHAQRKLVKGGAKNAVFILCAIERLPEDLCALADAITINYPWGSLLKAVVEPDLAVMTKIAKLGRSNARLDIAINWSVFENDAYRQTLGLNKPDMEHLKRVYFEAGIQIRKCEFAGEDSAKTTWGQKLTKGAGRKVLRIEATII